MRESECERETHVMFFYAKKAGTRLKTSFETRLPFINTILCLADEYFSVGLERLVVSNANHWTMRLIA